MRRKRLVSQARLEYLNTLDYWTQEDVADYFWIGLDRVREWRKEGMPFHAESSGRGVRFKRTEAIEWYDNHRKRADNDSGKGAAIFDNKPRRKGAHH